MSISLQEQNGDGVIKKRGCFGCLTLGCLCIIICIAIPAVPMWYFCLHTSPLIISPETTYITEPLTADGYPDYFGAYEKTWLSKLSPPENNGQRDLIIACGPNALEQQPLVNAVAWNEFPTHEKSKKWYNDYYVPLCQAMNIDPAAEPKYLHSKDWLDAMLDQKKYKDKPEANEHFKRLTENLWKAEDEPETATWLAERSPVLDIFGGAVRKQNFVSWRQRTDLLIEILLPDVQSNRRYLRDLQIRIAERIGQNDVDGAWYDIMSILYFSRHYLMKTCGVEKFFGIAAEQMAAQSIKLLLQKGNPSKEQLAKFAAELDSLPNRWQSEYANYELERMWTYSFLFYVVHNGPQALSDIDSKRIEHPGVLRFLFRNTTDLNLCCRRLSYYTSPLTQAAADIKTLRNKVKEHDRNIERMCQLSRTRNPFLFVFVQQRSEALTDLVLALCSPHAVAMYDAIFKSGAQFELARIAVALERYKKDENEYPDELQALMPKYLKAVPDDPFTWKPFTFSRNADGYTLYSFGANETDDGGINEKDKDECEKDDVIW